MRAIIDDGYTRHVGVGDNITVPEIEFKYRPPIGASIQELPFRQARSEDPTAETVKALCEHIEWWDFDGCEENEPTPEVMHRLDAFAFRDLVNVVLNGAAPKTIFDDRDKNLPQEEQQEVDAGN